jgi:hypothetical protein
MKNRAEIGVVLVLLASLTCFVATGFGQSAAKVEIKADYIVVHPGAKISTPDAKALDDVLKQYDKSLYKVDIYKSGQTTSMLGNLRDMCVDQRAVAELMQAKAQGQSDRAIQLIAPGSAVNPTSSIRSIQGSPSPGTAVNPTSGVSTQGSPVNPTMAPVNPTKPLDEAGTPAPSGALPSGPQKVDSSIPSGPQAAVNPQVAVNPTNTTQPCGSTDPKASEFLQRVKPILEKYSR